MNAIGLTTPVSYIGTVDMEDPFLDRRLWGGYSEKRLHPGYVYVNYAGGYGIRWAQNSGLDPEQMPRGYAMASQGPDQVDNSGTTRATAYMFDLITLQQFNDSIYAMSNGLYSLGDISLYGGALQAPASLTGG